MDEARIESNVSIIGSEFVDFLRTLITLRMNHRVYGMLARLDIASKVEEPSKKKRVSLQTRILIDQYYSTSYKNDEYYRMSVYSLNSGRICLRMFFTDSTIKGILFCEKALGFFNNLFACKSAEYKVINF